MRKLAAFLIAAMLCASAFAADLAPTQVKDADSGTTVEGIAGATITAGDVLYKDPNDSNKLKLATSESKGAAKAVGIALHNSVSGRHIIYHTAGTVTLFSADTLVDGEFIFLSASGKMQPRADLSIGEYVTLIGVADEDGKRVQLTIKPTGLIKQ